MTIMERRSLTRARSLEDHMQDALDTVRADLSYRRAKPKVSTPAADLVFSAVERAVRDAGAAQDQRVA